MPKKQICQKAKDNTNEPKKIKYAKNAENAKKTKNAEKKSQKF